jgi:hypothetical protein
LFESVTDPSSLGVLRVRRNSGWRRLPLLGTGQRREQENGNQDRSEMNDFCHHLVLIGGVEKERS